MDVSELFKRYKAGEREFFGVNLKNANLSKANLRNANLSNAELSNSNLNNAFLLETILTKANLSNADLSNAELSGIILIAANLSQSNLSQSTLLFANLAGANLSDANLSHTDLTGANLWAANLSRANLNRANLDGVTLSGADLSGANLSGADLSGTNLSKVNLSGADLSGTNLFGANLHEANLTNTNLSDAKLNGTILGYQKISEELQQENQKLKNRIDFFETQIENLIEQQVQKRLVTNQGITAKKSLTWNRLRFRSDAEREVAKVLDEMGIMFFPNASGRIMSEDGMTTREVDFLICWRGKWGILECDNEIMHLVNSIKKGKLPSAASDHNRDNDFNRHGQWFIKRFTEEECKKNPRKVVQQFLDMLHKFHEDQCYLITGNSTKIKKESEALEYDEDVDVRSWQAIELAELQKRLEAMKDEDGDIPF